ncbi:MAG: DUF2306 domain-containing protein [Marinobacter sp.]|uniref:DUF2306 domain-containing protein n=1 Tax=Marinobacter sp. TaxID=50741 RepID=UPI00299E3A15|nr:DUF2306 domain-containing protein [Marinobacter sp.]MDX1635459.1 DUF2306 domain-containing protein [Marinobacter sp.]
MNIEIFTEAPFAIQSHILVAFGAVVAGGLQLALPKGTPLHRATGRAWVLFMVIVVLTSFFIHELRVWGIWSPIHGLSIFTLAVLIIGVRAARRGKVRTHAITMALTYFLALILTGALTLLPGRMMHQMVFS